mmetsp:Transcript_54478/g.121897  ORF Transcript_54478/g.121897 Transcript_54478/m.121897 type:complete len:102 (-) Transcript_54478:73-378(-)
MGQTCLESKGQLSVISRSGGPLDEFQRVAPRKPDVNYFCLASVGCVVLILWLETRNLVKGRRKMLRRYLACKRQWRILATVLGNAAHVESFNVVDSLRPVC